MGRRRKSGLLNLLRRRSSSRFGFDDWGWRWGQGLNWNVSPDTKQGIWAILLFVLATLSLLGLLDLSGKFGQVVADFLMLLLGQLKWLFPILAALFCYFLARQDQYQVKTVNYFGAILLTLGLTALWHLRYLYSGYFDPLVVAKKGLGGGYVGALSPWLMLTALGFWGTLVVDLALFLTGLLLTFETSIYGLMWPVRLARLMLLKLKDSFLFLSKRTKNIKLTREDYEEVEEETADAAEEAAAEPAEEEIAEDRPQFFKKSIERGEIPDEELASIAKPKRFGKKIELPLALLSSKSSKPTSGDIKANQETIRKTLANFGIEVEMSEVNIGPTVTQYTLRPADGVKLSKIINLNSDLALALAAHPIRIEAPIPGRSLVGVEVPNRLAARVTMNEMLSSREFKGRGNNLSMAMGKDVSGNCYFAQLDRMPHLLIAGATGSGKSVCINSVIISLLYQNSPDDLKFILVDPKRVELPLYNGIPYLLTPVITDIKKTINALKWTIVEMEKRFELLSKMGKRNIASYNQAAGEKLPYIVFIIDELADLMSVASVDVEAGIVRLAQMARAVGIHLILATQRPSVEVITGLIKANIPARVAFSVASLIDSRTILDTSGAEKLVGRGDMLYLGPEITKPKRLQGVFLSDQEIKTIIDYIKKQGEADYLPEVVEKPGLAGVVGGYGASDGDPLLSEAKEIIGQSGKASASLLQRRLKLGYARAARILDLLEEQGVVGPADGAKPREIFLEKLGGVGAVEFAAREHDLEGELRPLEEEETEPTFTAFVSQDDDLTEEAEIEEIDEKTEDLEKETKKEWESLAAEDEKDEDENEELTAKQEKQEAGLGGGATGKKKVFKEDEWT